MAVDPTKALIVLRGPVVEGEVLRPVGTLVLTIRVDTSCCVAALRDLKARRRAHPDACRMLRPPDEANVIEMETDG